MLLTEKQEVVTSRENDLGSLLGSNDPALSRLLLLFPSAKPVTIPILVGLPGRAKGRIENTTVMFRASETAIFSLNFPVCGGEALLLRSPGEAGAASAVVVALIPYGRGLAVAVRFHEGTPRWFLKARARSTF